MRNLQVTGEHLLEYKQRVQILLQASLSTLPLAAGHTKRFVLEKNQNSFCFLADSR